MALVGIGALTLSAALALLCAGCGGPSPEERFAESVCSTAIPRAQEMLEIYDDVRHIRATPGAYALPLLLGPIYRGKKVAMKFGDDMRAVPVPNTEAGRSAAIHLQDEARAAFGILAAYERRFNDLPENPTLLQTIHALNDLEVALVSAVVGASIEYRITTYVPELREPFEKADSCNELDALGTD